MFASGPRVAVMVSVFVWPVLLCPEWVARARHCLQKGREPGARGGTCPEPRGSEWQGQQVQLEEKMVVKSLPVPVTPRAWVNDTGREQR